MFHYININDENKINWQHEFYYLIIKTDLRWDFKKLSTLKFTTKLYRFIYYDEYDDNHMAMINRYWYV